jgi:heat shock protein HslJ
MIRRGRSIGRILAVVSLLVIIGACLIVAGCTTNRLDTASDEDRLNGTTWSLESYMSLNGTLVSVIQESEVTAGFDGGKVSGTAGCNVYGGEYRQDEMNLTMSSLFLTKMHCTAPYGIMEQENRYINLLGSAIGYRIEDDRLILADAGGSDVLIYRQIETPQQTVLTGTLWRLEAYSTGNGVSPAVAGTNVTATFSEDGGLGGNAGCNHYFASYRINGSGMTVQEAGSTLMYCGDPPGIMNQESVYLDLLGGAAEYRIDADRLEILGSDGEFLLAFRAE